MHRENPLSPAEQELERQLSQLVPVRPGIDRDTLMFKAGQQAARSGAQRWRFVAATLMVVVMGLSARMLVPTGREEGPVLAEIGATLPIRPEPSEPSGTLRATIPMLPEAFEERMGYLRLRNLVALRGVDALPDGDWVAKPDGAQDSIGAERLRRLPIETQDGLWNWNAHENGDRS